MALAQPKHNYTELKAKLLIDTKRLDDMLQVQPQLFSDAADSYAEAASFRDRAKEALEELDAGIAHTYRSSTTDKLTEARVEEHVHMHPDHITQAAMYLEYKAMAETWLGLCKAFEQRIESIRHLVTLQRQGYFGSGLVDNEYTTALAASAEARKARSPSS